MELSIQKLSKSYDSLKIIQEADLVVSSGSLVAISGESGAGKSTLFHLLSGLDDFESGEIQLGEYQFQKLNHLQKAKIRGAHIGIVFQEFHLVPALTALENVRLVLDIHQEDIPLSNRDEVATEILNQVGLGSRLSHRPSELSGGEQQRVALARALVHRPPLVLADEPTGNLDEKTSNTIQELLIELCKSAGSSLVLITHDPKFAMKMEKVYQLQEGKLHLVS